MAQKVDADNIRSFHVYMSVFRCTQMQGPAATLPRHVFERWRGEAKGSNKKMILTVYVKVESTLR